jgi:two-component sensor histidine kinase
LKTSFEDQAQGILHHLAIEPINLDFDTAIPCGLILNELLTNVYKYAFPAGFSPQQPPRVEVSLSEKDHQIHLNLRDNGIGFTNDFENRKEQALGLQLTDLLVQQIRGTLRIDGSAGVAIEIIFSSPSMKSGGPHVGSPDSGG